MAVEDAKQAVGNVRLSEAERAKWIASGQILRDHFAAMNLKQLWEECPNETENRLRIAAEGGILKVPLGKSQQRPDREHSR
jgi:hypothetical protein